MTPYYQDDWLTVYHGDCKAVMAEMEPESVHCVVTSPPYWGLRDYDTASWEGGDPTCDHKGPPRNQSDTSTLGIYADGTSRYKDGWRPELQAKQIAMGTPYRHVCGKCDATRIDAQLGLEPTPEEYVANIVAVFREVRRVLRDDGTVWLNLGDSYVSTSAGYEAPPGVNAQVGSTKRGVQTRAERPPGLKPKDLVGIPWRVAFALQADGWYLRSDIIWSKNNPMPESVTDRPTKSHEYLFLLSKSPRYYFDADAVREAVSETPGADAWRRMFDPSKQSKEAALKAIGKQGGPVGHRDPDATGRNIRSVWTVATAPYPGAHFATFPPKLVEPCIKAGTSEKGVCPECGAPWERETERRPTGFDGAKYGERVVLASGGAKTGGTAHSTLGSGNGKLTATYETTGWRPTCTHVSPLPPQPAVVLDCFAGSGTTGMVAQSLSRRAVLIDLSLDYLRQLMDRNAEIPLGLGA